MAGNASHYAKELFVVFDSFGLNQHVTGPTHCRGHTLDLVVTKGVNIVSIIEKNVAVSENYCVFFDMLTCPDTQSNLCPVRTQSINENTSALFVTALSSKLRIASDSVDVLCDNLNSKIVNIMDDITPIKKQISIWQNGSTL